MLIPRSIKIAFCLYPPTAFICFFSGLLLTAPEQWHWRAYRNVLPSLGKDKGLSVRSWEPPRVHRRTSGTHQRSTRPRQQWPPPARQLLQRRSKGQLTTERVISTICTGGSKVVSHTGRWILEVGRPRRKPGQETTRFLVYHHHLLPSLNKEGS